MVLYCLHHRLVAFTLRKENEEMPRREILRAVESTGKMGFAERSFLWVFSWLDTRFRFQDYWNMSKGAYYNMHRQMPLTHAEKYKLRIIWYWYPLYCLGGISFLSFIILVITGTVLGIYLSQVEKVFHHQHILVCSTL